MRKTFREQMKAVIEERYRNDDAASKKTRLVETTTPAAEALITYIRQWPGQHQSRNQALGRLMECNRWNDRGELVLDTDHKGKAYPCRLPLNMAYEDYQFGDQRQQFWPMYNFPDAIKHIPANMKKCWADEIKELFCDINRMPLSAAKIISLGKHVKAYGINNPHTFAQWERQVSEFDAAQKAINAFVVTRPGWEYLTTENMQNPTHKAEMSKILEDILAGADARVEPSITAIKEQDRRLYVRQDATQARNNVKSVEKFLKKYGNTQRHELALVIEIIDNTESKSLVS